MKLRLNLGCGFVKMEGFVNVDNWAGCEPDVVCELDKERWPFDDNSVEYVLFDHSLEHMGASTDQFFYVMKELYRVCAPDAEIQINVPHPRSDLYSNDPTHVRAIYPETLGMFDLEINQRQVDTGMKNSKLAMQTGTNFKIINITFVPSDRMRGMSRALMELKLLSENNVANEIHFKLKAVKSQ